MVGEERKRNGEMDSGMLLLVLIDNQHLLYTYYVLGSVFSEWHT